MMVALWISLYWRTQRDLVLDSIWVVILKGTSSSSRGGWTRSEMRHGSIIQYASVYEGYRGVRISDQATGLKGNFAHIFDINAEHRIFCSTILWITLPSHGERWRQQNLGFFWSSPRVKVGTHDGTSPCDKSLQQVAGTSRIVWTDHFCHKI